MGKRYSVFDPKYDGLNTNEKIRQMERDNLLAEQNDRLEEQNNKLNEQNLLAAEANRLAQNTLQEQQRLADAQERLADIKEDYYKEKAFKDEVKRKQDVAIMCYNEKDYSREEHEELKDSYRCSIKFLGTDIRALEVVNGLLDDVQKMSHSKKEVADNVEELMNIKQVIEHSTSNAIKAKLELERYFENMWDEINYSRKCLAFAGSLDLGEALATCLFSIPVFTGLALGVGSCFMGFDKILNIVLPIAGVIEFICIFYYCLKGRLNFNDVAKKFNKVVYGFSGKADTLKSNIIKGYHDDIKCYQQLLYNYLGITKFETDNTLMPKDSIILEIYGGKEIDSEIREFKDTIKEIKDKIKSHKSK